jgi:hypothetical protein
MCLDTLPFVATLTGVWFLEPPITHRVSDDGVRSMPVWMLRSPRGDHTGTKFGTMRLVGALAVVGADAPDVLDAMLDHVIACAILALAEEAISHLRMAIKFGALKLALTFEAGLQHG